MRGATLPILALCALAVPAPAETLAGTARAIDGDTIAVGGVTVRLKGVAAPELDHPGLGIAEEVGGRAAADFVRAVVEGRAAV